MSRQGYLLVKGDSSDISANGVVLDTLTIRDLITKAEISRITLNPVNGYLKSGHPSVPIPQSLCRTSDGFLWAGCHYSGGGYGIWKIDPETGVSTFQNCLAGLANWQLNDFVDGEFIYDWNDSSTTQTQYTLFKTNRTTLALESYIQIGSPAAWTYGLGWDGINWWTGDATNKEIQKRSALNLTVVTDYPYPTGYETASFYCLQIDPENPTHLWLQGEMGSNGVVVVWDTATQTIVSEWSSADIMRWKDQQFAIGGADISTPGTIQFLSTGPFKKGNAIFDYLLSDAESDVHNVVSVQYSVDGLPPLIDGLPNPDKVWLDATIGTGGSGNTNLPSSPTGEYLKKAWDTITDTGTGDTLGVYFRLILEEI